MVDRRIGVIINGATGRMGTTQHMANLLAIAAEGGLKLRNGDRLVPDLLLVGRDADRLSALAAGHDGLRWTTNLAEALAGPDNIYMDCAATGDRPARVRRAIARQAYPYRKADRAYGRRSDGAGAPGEQSWR
jgi:predicted dehydrogenase